METIDYIQSFYKWLKSTKAGALGILAFKMTIDSFLWTALTFSLLYLLVPTSRDLVTDLFKVFVR